MNVVCTVADDARFGDALSCSSLPLSPLEIGLSLDAVTDSENGGGVPHPFALRASSSFVIEIGSNLNSDAAPSLSLDVLNMPQYVIGTSVCEPRAISGFESNGTMLDFDRCEMNAGRIARITVIVTLLHVDKPPYFTISSVNISASAVGVIGEPIWIPLSNVVVNPDPVYPYNMTSFELFHGPCSGTSSQSLLPFSIAPLTGSVYYYSVNGSISAWSSPVSLCILAVTGGLLNASLDATVWLTPVLEQLVVSSLFVNATHFAPGVTYASLDVLFSPASEGNASWTAQAPSLPWLEVDFGPNSSSIHFTFNSTGLATLNPSFYDAVVLVYTTGDRMSCAWVLSSPDYVMYPNR